MKNILLFLGALMVSFSAFAEEPQETQGTDTETVDEGCGCGKPKPKDN